MCQCIPKDTVNVQQAGVTAAPSESESESDQQAGVTAAPSESESESDQQAGVTAAPSESESDQQLIPNTLPPLVSR